MKKVTLFWAFFLIGFVPAWELATSVTFATQGFNLEEASGSSDCDDCVVTTLLDGLPYLAGILLVYVVAGVAVFVMLKRRGMLTR